MIKNLSNMKNHIEALEEERRKIHVFQHELPLCLELVTQAIDAYKREIKGNVYGQSESSEKITGECRPVLDLFIPIKHCSNSLEDEEEVDDEHDDDDDDDEHDQSHETDINFDDKNMKSEWLKSAQLWNQSVEVLPEWNHSQQETETVIEINKGNERATSLHDMKTPATTNGGNGRQEKDVEKNYGSGCDGDRRGQKKKKRCWSEELHRLFLDALKQLGGTHATPKQIREIMKVDGLTNDEIKSHLQKYRLHIKRSLQTTTENKNSQTPHFVVFGGIWVPQTNHSTANAVATGETTTGIYKPMISPLSSEWYNFGSMISEDRSRRCSIKRILRCSSSTMFSSTRTKTK